VIRRAGGIPIAFVGVVLEDAPSIVSAAGIAGLEFGDEADAINALVPTLRRRGVRAIVVLAHEGGQQSQPGGINDCNALVGPITAIADRLSPQVDVIHSAHTHQPYVCRRGGRLLTSSASFGRLITDIDLELDPGSRDVAKAEAVNRIVTQDVPRNAAMSRLLARYQALAAPLRDRVIGATAGPLTREQNPAGESTLGDVIADAQLAATQAANGALAAFMNPGGIRADLDAGEVTYGEAFSVQPFGNSLVTLTLTGKQVDTLLEQQWCGQDPAFPRILQVSKRVTYTWDPAKPACDRVEDASIRLGGAPVDAAGGYRVTVNSFLADGGDNFVVLREGTDRVGGGDDLDALEAYLAANAPLAVPPLDRIVRAG
jgi:5'-nucleotidase